MKLKEKPWDGHTVIAKLKYEKPIMDEEDVTAQAVARAVQAERERCMSIVKKEALSNKTLQEIANYGGAKDVAKFVKENIINRIEGWK